MAQSLSNLPIGAKIKFGKHSVNGETAQDIIWLVVAKNHSGYPANSVTLLTEKGIDVRPYDARESSNTDSNRGGYGNNYYPHSNISQWLNSSASSNWYSPQHTYDAPPSSSNVSFGTQYVDRPGFLYNFSSSERNAIPSTTIRCLQPTIDGGKYADISAQVFLPSLTEVTGEILNNIAEGARWSFFQTSPSLMAKLTNQVVENTTLNYALTMGANHDWWLRTPNPTSSYFLRYVSEGGATTYNTSPSGGSIGVRPAMNLTSTLSVSDTTDSDGCYTAVWNSAPPVPTTLNVPTIYGGKSTTISWSGVTDPDGDSVTYQLEMAVNGGSYTTLYSGANLSYTTSVTYGTTSVQFRLKAVDSQGASSGYITSTSRTVINNIAPVISGSNTNLGTKNGEFSQTYTITDTDGNTVTVTEAIDGVAIRSYVVTLGATNTVSVTGNTWLALANGNHTITITATDGRDTSVRTYTFTKSVSSFTIQNTTPLSASTKPVRIKVSVERAIPAGAVFKVEVCRNGFDSTKTWEDATSSVTGNQAHVFQTEIASPSAGKWGILYRVTVNRNGKSGECWVKSIGGNFE